MKPPTETKGEIAIKCLSYLSCCNEPTIYCAVVVVSVLTVIAAGVILPVALVSTDYRVYRQQRGMWPKVSGQKKVNQYKRNEIDEPSTYIYCTDVYTHGYGGNEICRQSAKQQHVVRSSTLLVCSGLFRAAIFIHLIAPTRPVKNNNNNNNNYNDNNENEEKTLTETILTNKHTNGNMHVCIVALLATLTNNQAQQQRKIKHNHRQRCMQH